MAIFRSLRLSTNSGDEAEKGQGLGLATCYSIINRHAGHIDVESELGHGTTFHVYLPAAKEPIAMTSEDISSVHQGKGIFVIMDDEEAIREIIGKMLESFGYTVVQKKDGEELVEYVKLRMSQGLDIAGMILDLTVPGSIGGKDAVALIRELNTEIPIFVASGYSNDPVIANPSDYGFNASINKPFTKIALAKMLNKFCSAN